MENLNPQSGPELKLLTFVKDCLHLGNCTYLPLSIGQIWAIVVMPPAPKYCPIDTSSRKTGMPQNIMEMK